MTHEERAREIVKRMVDDHTILDDVPDRGWVSIKIHELEQSIAAALSLAAQEAEEPYIWSYSPAMAQAKIDELNAILKFKK